MSQQDLPTDSPFSFERLSSSLDSYAAWQLPFGHRAIQSAVVIGLRETSNGLEFLMLKRAKRKGDPWSGDMAFPGGKMSHSDENYLATALRETHEETGVLLSEEMVIGQLSDVFTRNHRNNKIMRVSVFVARWLDQASIEHSHESVDEQWFPLAYFSPRNREQMQWKLPASIPLKMHVPVYYYDQYRVWGLSLFMIDELYRLLVQKPKRALGVMARMRQH